MSTRNVCITAVEGELGFQLALFLLREGKFYKNISSLTGWTLYPDNPQKIKLDDLRDMGAKIVEHVPGRERTVVQALKDIKCDTLCLIPPAHQDKYDICLELISAAKKAGVQNVLLISAAGADYASEAKQPRLREFIDLETAVLSCKGDPDVPFGHSPCIIRAGFYAENLLLHSNQARLEGLLPLPIGDFHKFAPVALGDVVHVAAHVLAGKGKMGFDDRHRGQLMTVTGPLLCAGKELAAAGSEALGKELEFEDISEREARRVLEAQSRLDKSEMEVILEYYSLVREGKTNYIATTAFHDVTGAHPTEIDEFFKKNALHLRPSKKVKH